MLFTPGNSLNWSTDNFGATYTDTGLGTQITAGGSANTKNSTITSILTVTEDVYAITIGFTGGSQNSQSRRFLTDIYTDPAGGTTWGSSPIIANLASNASNIIQGGVWYFFPLFIKNGSSIGATCQSETANATTRILMRTFGKPSRAEVWKYGSKVQTYGAATGTTEGTAFTPGTSAMGSYSASLATTAHDLFWWQMGILINDTTQTAVQYLCDVAIGDASNKIIVMENVLHTNAGTSEQAGKPSAFGSRWPQKLTKDNQSVFVRGACTGTPDSNLSAIVYAVEL